MNTTDVTQSSRRSQALRWLARTLSLASVGTLLLFVCDGGNPWRLLADGNVLHLFFPFGVILGMLLAWRWEGWGGLLTLGSLAAFYGLHYATSGRWPSGWAFVLFSLPGLLFLLCWQSRRHPVTSPSDKPKPDL